MEQYKTHILTSNLASQYVIPVFTLPYSILPTFHFPLFQFSRLEPLPSRRAPVGASARIPLPWHLLSYPVRGTARPCWSRTHASPSRRFRSTRSGGWRRDLRHCHHENIHRTG